MGFLLDTMKSRSTMENLGNSLLPVPKNPQSGRNRSKSLPCRSSEIIVRTEGNFLEQEDQSWAPKTPRVLRRIPNRSVQRLQPPKRHTVLTKWARDSAILKKNDTLNQVSASQLSQQHRRLRELSVSFMKLRMSVADNELKLSQSK